VKADLAEGVRRRVQAAAALAGEADWLPVMEANELEALAARLESVASGLNGAVSRLRRLAKQKKKGGLTAADHIKK